MAFNAGEIQPDAEVVNAVAGGAITAGYVVVANASTSKFTVSNGAKPTSAVGIALTASDDATPVKVAISGKVAAVAGGAVKRFNYISADANGKIEAAIIDTDYIIGIALEDATAAGDVILVQMFPGFINVDTTT